MPIRAAIVASLAATLGLLALANLSGSGAPGGAEVQKPELHALTAAPVAYSLAVVSRIDSVSR